MNVQDIIKGWLQQNDYNGLKRSGKETEDYCCCPICDLFANQFMFPNSCLSNNCHAIKEDVIWNDEVLDWRINAK